MSDYAHDMTDKYISDIERRLKKEYAKAEQELQKKAEKHFERFKEKDEKMRKAMEDKSISKSEYKKWRSGQMLVGQRWNDMRDTIAQDLSNTNSIARSIIRGYMPEVYALNHNFGTYQIEKDSGMDTSYTLYSRETVEALMRDNPQLLPDPGKATENRIYNALDVRYNRQQLQSVATQAVLQGESIPKIAKRLVEEVGEKNRKAAVRNARTMMTCAENKGRMDSYKRAQAMGIECNKRWLSTHDNRTRDWHAELDEVSVPVDEPFENRAGKIMYPGDPTARPENVYNCRCRLVSDIKHVKSFSERLKEYEIQNTKSKGTKEDYDAWLKAHRDANKIHMPPSYLGRIDYKDKEAVSALLDKYGRGMVNSDIEEAIVITKEGRIYRCYGNTDHLYLEDDLGGKLWYSSLVHNHPDASQYNEHTFGKEDVDLFDSFKLQVMKGVDTKYNFTMSRLDKHVDPAPTMDRLLAYATMDTGLFRHYQMIQTATQRGFGYTRTRRNK